MINALSYTGYTGNEESTKRNGLTLVNIALTDPDFERRWTDPNLVCTENQGLTQMQILIKMREDIGVEFRAYRKWWSKVIGYFVSGDVLWDNLKFLDGFTEVESGSNDFHETAHMKGFTHDGVWESSVPYTLNRVFEAWAADYLAKQAVAAQPLNTALAHAMAADEEHA